MKTTVIFSTYNSPDWMEKVLWGFIAQTERDFEIIIADDGSRDYTRERIERLGRAFVQMQVADELDRGPVGRCLNFPEGGQGRRALRSRHLKPPRP